MFGHKKGASPFPLPMDRKSKFLTSSNPRSPRVFSIEKTKSKAVALDNASGAEVGESEVWERFRDAGLLDESEMRRKDREALAERIQELEAELHDYQYHMGLLLIDKEKRTSESEELRQALSEVEETIKREQTAHMIAISELEKREEYTKKALMVERQCVKDLEKALLKMKTEIAEAKLTSDKKLVKPHLLEADNEHGRDLAFQGVEEEEIDIRLHNLVTKEKEVDDKQMNLEKKEREFLTREERLVVRERVEAQKLLDDRKLLDSQKQEFELRTKKERKSFEDDIKDKMDALELKKCEISYKEEENLIREHTLESRMEKLKDKEKEIDTKLRLLTEREESANKESQKLKDEKEQLAIDIKKLETSKAELESSRTAINAEKQQIIRQKENLKLAQIEVKQETVDCGIMKNSIMKETEELTHEKIKFDREMKSLYEKGTSLATEREQLNNDKEAFNVWRYIEEEKLKNESLKMRVYIQQDAEELRMKEAALEKERSVFSLELESKMKVLEEMEEKLQEKRNDIERVKVMNQKIVKSPNFVDESNSPEMKMDQDRLTREEIDISAKRRKLDIDQFETRNIETVQMHMGDEQEEFIEERDHFLPAVDQCNICKNRGVKIDDLCSIELQTPSRTATKRNIVIEKHIDGSKSVGLSRHLPFLQKCSMPFNSSLRDTGRHPIDGISSEHTSLVGFETKTEKSPDRANSEIQYRKRGRPKTTKRRNSVRAVVNDPKAIPGDISKEKGQQTSDRAEVFVVIDEGSQRDSENVSAGEGHSKCQNDAPGTPISGEKRYNFRLSTINRRFWK